MTSGRAAGGPGDAVPGALARLLRLGAGSPPVEPERRVVVVTDSTACLTAEDAARHGIVVVPLDVAADGTRYRDGVDLDGDGLAALLRDGRRVTTSQPAPAALVDAYEQAARAGAAEVVSVHLSGELSGTVRAAGLAAQLAPLPVRVVDSRSAGLGLGFAAVAAAQAARPPGAVVDEPAVGGVVGRWTARWGGARRGGGARSGRISGEDGSAGAAWVPDGAVIAGIAERVGRSTSAWFLVDSLDHLRRGGRISGPAAAFGTVLGLRPVLTLTDGRIEVAERVRTRRAARDRLVDLVLAEVARRGAGGQVRVGVQHLGRADVAEEIAARVRAATGLGAEDVLVREVGAVLGGHVGPGALAVMVTDR